jgi:TRAP-type C4-dicarboxylate transport system permease small subunit
MATLVASISRKRAMLTMKLTKWQRIWVRWIIPVILALMLLQILETGRL